MKDVSASDAVEMMHPENKIKTSQNRYIRTRKRINTLHL
jgi:hypothetical protein